ncbi:MAG: HAMP domain-containing protein [Candidatus Riflebacteria bacterium]|nr:HAMP domain-containing protein [Candidatus Riflebacteria bacterium]
MFVSLRVKILGLLFLLIAGLAMVFNESATRLIFEKTEETFQERMFVLADSSKVYWESDRNLLLRTAALYCESERIVNYSSFGLYNLLLREMQRLIAGSAFADLQIALANGTSLAAADRSITRGPPLNPADPRLSLSAIQAVRTEEGLEMSAVVPIHKMGEILGRLTLRRLLDDTRLRRMSRNLQADITLAVRSDVTASSLTGQARRDMMVDVYRNGDTHPRFFTLPLDGKIHSVCVVEVGETQDHRPIRVYCTLSQEKMRSLVEQARGQNLQLTMLALVVSMFLSALFSERFLTASIRAIRDGANRISQGDLGFSLSETRRDELGDLARSFNDMAANLQANRDKLEHYIQSLEQLKNYIQNILGSLETCVITWTREGRIETVNAAAEKELTEFFGGLSGLSLRRFLRPMNRPSRGIFLQALRRLIRDDQKGLPFDLEFDLGPNRGFKVMQGIFSYLRDSAGRPLGMVLTLDDITQRRIIEQQLYHADKLSSIGQLAASVAHEIKNPLASIKTLGQLLQEETPPVDTRREYIDVIVSEVDRLNGVVEQLLKYARPEGSSFRRVKLSEVIDPVLALVHHESERHRVVLETGFDPGLEVFVDAEKIKQVFLNLIFNAIQAFADGGRVMIRGFLDPGSPWTILQVEDNGPGIPADHLARVFEPFFTTKQRGTGLGLAIVKKIIDLHGGKIEVKSRPQEGTTFTMYLPFERKD